MARALKYEVLESPAQIPTVTDRFAYLRSADARWRSG